MLTENGKENAITPYNFANKISLNYITLFIFPFFFFFLFPANVHLMKVRSGLEREMTQLLKAKVTTKMKIRSAELYLATCTVFWGEGLDGEGDSGLWLCFSVTMHTHLTYLVSG